MNARRLIAAGEARVAAGLDVPADHVLVVREVDGEPRGRVMPRVEALHELLPHVPPGGAQAALIRACEPDVMHIAIAAIAEPDQLLVAHAKRWPWVSRGGDA